MARVLTKKERATAGKARCICDYEADEPCIHDLELLKKKLPKKAGKK